MALINVQVLTVASSTQAVTDTLTVPAIAPFALTASALPITVPGVVTLQTGTVAILSGSNVVTGTGTLFTTALVNGCTVQFASQPGALYIVQNIISDTLLMLTTTYLGVSNATTNLYLQYLAILSGVPVGFQFITNFTTGVLTFPATAGGVTFNVNYNASFYVPTAGTISADIELWGGGGAGGNAIGANPLNYSVGSGGGAGGYAKYFLPSIIASQYEVTIGTGGGTPVIGAPFDGGNTSFNTGTLLITAYGGKQGKTIQVGASLPEIALGGSGGALATNGTYNSSGNSGEEGLILSKSYLMGGMGGSTSLGGAGDAQGITGTGFGKNATPNTGSGGGGAINTNTTSLALGGFGSTGVIIISEYDNAGGGGGSSKTLTLTIGGGFQGNAPFLLTDTAVIVPGSTSGSLVLTEPAGEGIKSFIYTESTTLPTKLTSIFMPALTTIQENFAPTNLSAITSISLPLLATVGGNFDPGNMPLLTTLSTPSLATVGGNYAPDTLSILPSLSVPALTTVGGDFVPGSLLALTNLSIPVLATIGGTFGPASSPLLATLSAPALTTVGGSISVAAMDSLTNLSFPLLANVGGEFDPNALASLTTLALPSLINVGGDVNINNMPLLTSLTFPVLANVNGEFGPELLDSLTSLTLPVLTNIGGDFNISNMALLASISFPMLITLGGFHPESMPLLTLISMPALTTVGDFEPAGLGSLVTLSLPSLVTMGALFPNSLTALATLLLPALTSVTSIQFDEIPQMISMSLPSLTVISGLISFLDMALLTTISLPALVHVGDGSHSIDFQPGALQNLTFGTVGVLKSVSLGSPFTAFGQALTQASVDGILQVLASLDGTGGTTLFAGPNQINLDGGTNAAPSVAGLAYAAVLTGRGVTVTTN